MRRLLALLLCLCLPVSALGAERADVVYHGDRESQRIALTLDDCYSSTNLQRALELCEKYDVPFTFFVVGSALKEEDRELWRALLDAGCEIGNHTYGHSDLLKLRHDAQLLHSSLRRTQEAVDRVLGYAYPMQVLRPPYGHVLTDERPRVTPMLYAEGYTVAVLWDVSQTDPAKAARAVKGGSILLYHTNIIDIKCLDALIPQLLAKGFEPVTVSELLGMPPVATASDLIA